MKIHKQEGNDPPSDHRVARWHMWTQIAKTLGELALLVKLVISKAL